MWHQHTGISRTISSLPPWIRKHIPVWCLQLWRMLHRRQHFGCVPSAPAANPFFLKHLWRRTNPLKRHADINICPAWRECTRDYSNQYWGWWPGDTGKKSAGGASQLCGLANHEAHRQWRHWAPGGALGPGRSSKRGRSRSSPSESKQDRVFNICFFTWSLIIVG